MDTLDKTDLQILRTLQENARLTTKELAARVSLSSTPVFERLKRLESGGYIKKYIAVLDAEKLNQGFVVFCSVKLRRLNRDIAAEFTRMIQGIPEVTECYNISGSYDYLLKIHAPNMKYYQEFILNVLGTIDSLGSLESTFVMDEVKHLFKPEFLNRIDEIIVFHQLTEENIRSIARRMLDIIGGRMAQQGITLQADDDAVAALAKDGFDARYGARPLRRYVQHTVETMLSKRLLRGDVTPGQTVTVDAENGELVMK